MFRTFWHHSCYVWMRIFVHNGLEECDRVTLLHQLYRKGPCCYAVAVGGKAKEKRILAAEVKEEKRTRLRSSIAHNFVFDSMMNLSRVTMLSDWIHEFMLDFKSDLTKIYSLDN